MSRKTIAEDGDDIRHSPRSAVSGRAIEEVVAAIPETNAIIVHPAARCLRSRGLLASSAQVLPPVGELSDLAGALLVFEGRPSGGRRADCGRRRRPMRNCTGGQDRYHAAAVSDRTRGGPGSTSPEELIGIDDVRGELAALARSAIDNWLAHTDAPTLHRSGRPRRCGRRRNATSPPCTTSRNLKRSTDFWPRAFCDRKVAGATIDLLSIGARVEWSSLITRRCRWPRRSFYTVRASVERRPTCTTSTPDLAAEPRRRW